MIDCAQFRNIYAGTLLFLGRKTIADKMLIGALRKRFQTRHAADRTPVESARLHRIQTLDRRLAQSPRHRKEPLFPFLRRRKRHGSFHINFIKRMSSVR